MSDSEEEVEEKPVKGGDKAKTQKEVPAPRPAAVATSASEPKHVDAAAPLKPHHHHHKELPKETPAHDDVRQDAPTQNGNEDSEPSPFPHVDLSKYATPVEIEALGLEHLKVSLLIFTLSRGGGFFMAHYLVLSQK